MEEQTTEALDPWVINEMEQLRADLMDAEELVADTEAENEYVSAECESAKAKYFDLRRDFTDKLSSANQELSKKLIMYSDLFDEYDTIIKMYVSQTGVELVTNKMKQLRLKGELNA